MFYEDLYEPYIVNLYENDKFYFSVTFTKSKEPYFIITMNKNLKYNKFSRISFNKVRFIGKDKLNLTKKELKYIINALKKVTILIL